MPYRPLLRGQHTLKSAFNWATTATSAAREVFLGNPKKSNPTLKDLLSTLTTEVVLARTHLGIAKRLRAARPVVLSAAPTFFAVTHNAHLDAAQMYAAKLYDKTKNAITVRTVLDEAEHVAGSFPNSSPQDVRRIVCAARSRIVKFESTLSALENRRNEYLAHLDVKTIADQTALYTRASLTFDGLDNLLVETGNILNDISQLYDGTLAVLELPDSDDCEKILRLISRRRRASG